jgi:chromosome segregation ATPase
MTRKSQAAQSTSAPATVRLEVRASGARPVVYEVGDGGFLIGSVPGCDLRLPGVNLAPVLCLIARSPQGLTLRRLAPVQSVHVNGKPVSGTYLASGDIISLAGIEMVVTIEGTITRPPEPSPEHTARQRELQSEIATWEQRRRAIEAEVIRQANALEQLKDQEQELLSGRRALEGREAALRDQQAQVAQRLEQLTTSAHEVLSQKEEVQATREELARIKQDLLNRYQGRRDRLATQAMSIRKAVRKMRKRQERLVTLETEFASRSEVVERRELEVQSREEVQARDKEMMEEQHAAVQQRQQEFQSELHQRTEDLQSREASLVQRQAALEKGQKQHQGDLVRLDRIQGQQEQRGKQLEQRALEIDRRFEQMQKDSRDLEEQAGQLDDWHQRMTAESEALVAQKQEQEQRIAQMDQRAAALESQQTMLATLRTRVEKVREEIRRQEQALSDQRALQEAGEIDLRQRLEHAEETRREIEAEKQLYQAERARLAQREAVLEEAVTQLRLAQDSVEAERAEVEARRKDQENTAGDQLRQANDLLARAAQVERVQERLTADQAAIVEREQQLVNAEEAVATLQEHLRKRGEDLTEKLRAVDERKARLDQRDQELVAREQSFVGVQQQAAARLQESQGALEKRAGELAERDAAMEKRAEVLRGEGQRLAEASATLTAQRHDFTGERTAWDLERQQAREEAGRLRADFERARSEARDLLRLFPELESRAEAAVDRLLRAREQLREHLAEIHTYARQSRDELEVARKQVQGEAERVRQQELELDVARDEHRLAVAGFRQQLIEWQGQLGEMKKALARGEVQLDRKAAEVQEQAAVVASTSARLAQQADDLEHREQLVQQRTGEVGRHLADMQQWYRRKLRELAGVDGRLASDGDAYVVPLPTPAPSSGETPLTGPAEPTVLAIAGSPDPADQALGDLLRRLELIDAETLDALLRQARRERRSLRQVLLTGNYLTLYQMALIEAGNLDGLILGPVRVIDRRQSTSRESLYRVFDPRGNQEVLLRHLAETEMHDAVHPDEYRQRFTGLAAVRHPHLTAVYEVTTIADRPAVLQELLIGVPSSDWPALSSAPGVLYRLLTQASAALQAAHQAGFVHGRLTPASWVLTADGMLKLTGLGEPAWLSSAREMQEEPTPADDLLALGEIAAGWAATMGKGKGKGLPPALHTLLERLRHPEQNFASAAELLAALEALGEEVPANATAWERFVKQIREQAADLSLRRTA